MKTKLFVMGQPRGEIEIGENSVVAKLAKGDLSGAMGGLRSLQDSIDQLTKKHVLNIQPTKPVRGGKGFMATCPECGKRKRLNSSIRTTVKNRRSFYETVWSFWCSCDYLNELGTTEEVEALIQNT